MKKETTISKDIKTMWVDGCKDLVGWLQSFGQVERSEDRRKTDRGNDRRFNKFGEPEKPKRARTKGRYKADDKSTPNINEAWVGGKAPKKRKKNVKK
tara:strand:- start:391 stop:681 length:291 start_codon:yes stop_codon:yes gene_type:complete